MKKTIAKLLGHGLDPQTPATPKSPPPLATVAKEVDEIYGQRDGYVISIYFPEYKDLAPWLTEQARVEFIKGFTRCVSEVTAGSIRLIDIPETAIASIAIHSSEKQTPAAALKLIGELDKEMRVWTGTFGRIGMPMLKYRMGVVRGEMILAALSPKVLGSAMVQASEVVKLVCDHFDLRIATTPDLIRSPADLANWFDIDDCSVPMDLGDRPKTKTMRIFTTLNESRSESGDVEILRAGRKAYFQQKWNEAAEKFDRISRVPILRRIAEVYAERIRVLSSRPVNLGWDGVFRNDR